MHCASACFKILLKPRIPIICGLLLFGSRLEAYVAELMLYARRPQREGAPLLLCGVPFLPIFFHPGFGCRFRFPECEYFNALVYEYLIKRDDLGPQAFGK